MTSVVMDVRELTFDEVEYVSGGNYREAGQFIIEAGYTIAGVGGIARLAGWFPTPASPILMSFSTVAGGVGALMVIGGKYIVYKTH